MSNFNNLYACGLALSIVGMGAMMLAKYTILKTGLTTNTNSKLNAPEFALFIISSVYAGVLLCCFIPVIKLDIGSIMAKPFVISLAAVSAGMIAALLFRLEWFQQGLTLMVGVFTWLYYLGNNYQNMLGDHSYTIQITTGCLMGINCAAHWQLTKNKKLVQTN